MSWNKEIFVKRAKEIHGENFDYSNVIYVNANSNVEINCNICNIKFWCTPGNHIHKKTGCSGCRKRKISNILSSNTKEFISKSIAVHKNEYDYSLVNYTNAKTSVQIIHKLCNRIFAQTPHLHLRNNRCTLCYKNVTKNNNQFVQEANIIHKQKYDYSQCSYTKNNKTKVTIICKLCNNVFKQTPANHLQGQGCPVCAKKLFISKSETIWLDKLCIPTERRNLFITLKNKKIINVDAFHNQVVYEFYGDFWHGNIKIFNPNLLHVYMKIPILEIYKKTIERHNMIIESGYQIKFIWEDEQNKYLLSTCHPHERER